jgi:hypothetical protein
MRYVLVIIFIAINVCFGQKKINQPYFINLLKKGKYQQVFDEAMQIRNSVYGKCAIVDYFIAKSLCLDNHKQKSIEWFQFIKDSYPLKSNAKQFISNEMQSCSGNNVSPMALSNSFTVPLPQAGVSGVSKTGYVYDCSNREQLVNFENLVTEEELEARLFRKEEQRTAYIKTKELVGTNYAVDTSSRYILVSPASSNFSRNNVELVAKELDKAYTFFVSYYKLRAPDKLITVYLMPDIVQLQLIAKKIHNVAVPKELLGYSLLSDLSLLGIADPYNVGTLYHELFHLMIRTDAGDIPAWADEGIASLYAVSTWQNNKLMGNGNTWRIRSLNSVYLREVHGKIPLLKDMLSYNWEEFNGGEENNLCTASINYALANHFLIYLQQKNLLQPLVQVYRTRGNPGKAGDAPKLLSNIAIVEKLLNKPIDAIQDDFDKWFESSYHFSIKLNKMEPPM